MNQFCLSMQNTNVVPIRGEGAAGGLDPPPPTKKSRFFSDKM